MNQAEIDALIRHQTYIDRFGSGLANRTLKLFDDNELLALVTSKRSFKKKIQDLIAKDKKKANDFILAEVRQMARLELAFTQQLALDFKDVKLSKTAMNEIVDAALEKVLIVTNNTPQDLYDSAFNRKEQIATSLDSMNNLGLKESALINSEMLAMFSQFANGMQVANKTFSFAVANDIRETAYAKSRVVDRVVLSAILDGRTTNYCMDIDGNIYPKGEGPRPTFHPRCRTIGIPLIVGQTEAEVKELLSYRPQVGPGSNYEKGDDSSLRSTKNQISKGKTNVKIAGKSVKSSSSYANFLSSQTNTSEGIQFIQDRLGIRKGNRFIKLVEQGNSPDRILTEILYDTEAKDLDLNGLKKRIKQ